MTIEDKSYATNTINKGYATIIVGDLTSQTCFNVGVTAIDNWTERQDACWFMGAGVGVYDVPVCYLGGKYLNDSSVNRVQTLGSVGYLIRPGIIQRSGLKLYDKYVVPVPPFLGSNTYIANYSTIYVNLYSNTYIIS